MKLGANHPMGPLELGDFIGLDTVLSIMNVLYEGLADSKYRPCPLLVKYVEAGWLGRRPAAASTTTPRTRPSRPGERGRTALYWRKPEMLWGLLGVAAGVGGPAIVALVVAPAMFPGLILGATPPSAICGLLLIGWMLGNTDADGRFRHTRSWIVARALLIGIVAWACLAAVLAVGFADRPAIPFTLLAGAVILPSAVLGGLATAFIALRSQGLAQPRLDHLAADGAEGLVHRAHAAVELGPEGAGGAILGALEGADVRPGARQGLGGPEIGVGDVDQVAPLHPRPQEVVVDVRLVQRRVEARAGRGVLVGQPEGGVAELVDGDVGRHRAQRIDRHAVGARAAVEAACWPPPP